MPARIERIRSGGLRINICGENRHLRHARNRITPANRELRAQGIGNICSGLIGGLPITQVIVRSSANINSGGRTKSSSITHGVILLLSALLIPAFLNLIPLASLAGILLFIGYKLAKPKLFKSIFKLGLSQFIPFIVTIVAILLTDLLKGIGIGMVVAIFYILKKNYKNSHHLSQFKEGDLSVYNLQLSEEVTFLNKGSIIKTLNKIPENSKLIIDGTKSENIDFDVLEVIENFESVTAKNKNIAVQTLGVFTVV